MASPSCEEENGFLHPTAGSSGLAAPPVPTCCKGGVAARPTEAAPLRPRTTWLRQLVLGLVLGALAPLAAPTAQPWTGTPGGFRADRPPNVLFIIADDLNDAVGGLGGHPQARTPNLDRLRARGVTFTNGQTNSSICGPSRASLLTGLYPHTTGYVGYEFGTRHWRDNAALRSAVTFPEHLLAGGYHVLTTGKIYHNHQEDATLWYTNGVPPSWGPWPWAGTFDDDYAHGQLNSWPTSVVHPNQPEGFGVDAQFGSLDDVPDVPADPETGAPGYQGWRLFFRPYRYDGPDDRDPMPDELNAAWAAEQLTGPLAARADEPFLMMVGMNRPHSPIWVPQEYLDLFPLDSVHLAPRRPNDLDDVAGAFKDPGAAFSTGGYGFYKYDQVVEVGGEAMLRRWTQHYLAAVAFVDAQVGRILDALDASPFADNTLVVFTSDHGYHMGEKDYLFKNSPWEESARVPFFVYGPGVVPGLVVEQPVSLVDLYPTFMDYAGLPSDPNRTTNRLALDGHSLRPLLEGNGVWGGPRVALTAVASNDALAPGAPAPVGRQHYAVRSERYRYILANTGEEELYDHAADPHEWDNLADHPAHAEAKRALRADLARLTGR